MGLQRLGKTDAPLAVDLQSLARTVKRGAELLALLRIRRKTFDQRFDLRHQGVAPRIDRRHIERRITIETVEPVAREDCPVRRRDRSSPLGVEPQRGVRHEAVHQLHAPTYATFLGEYGLSWDIMGVNAKEA